jgi:hypothetical protein
MTRFVAWCVLVLSMIQFASTQSNNTDDDTVFYLDNPFDGRNNTNETSVVPFLQYKLPSFSLILKVSKIANNASLLINFQDGLKETIQDHLQDFFQFKLETILKLPTKVRFDLDSHLIWKELSIQGSSQQPSSDSYQNDTTQQNQNLNMKEYEVRGQYDTQVTLNYSINETDSEDTVVVGQSTMTLLLIESFQGRNYWDLVHRCESSPTLTDISSVEITVLEDGFVPYHGGTVAFDDDYWFTTQKKQQQALRGTVMSPGMIVALACITFFGLAIAAIWIYLCYNLPTSFFTNDSKRRQRRCKRTNLFKDNEGSSSSVTDSSSTNEDNISMEFFGDEELSIAESSLWMGSGDWMDIWAQKVTSIPIREQLPRRKKRRGQPLRQSWVRPAHQHVSQLDCITELDNESCCNSTVVSAKMTTSIVI